jgi:hypothetical protein
MTIRLYPAHPPLKGEAIPLEAHERSRFRAAARHAGRVLPGSLGELVKRELTAYAEFGYRFDRDPPIAHLATEVLALSSDSRSGVDRGICRPSTARA